MMDFKEFVKEVAEKIKDFLPEIFADAEVTIKEVTKNNDHKLTGIMIKSEGSNISPTVYLDDLYDRYKDGMDMTAVLQTVADIRVKNDVAHDFDIGSISDFDRVRDKIICKIVNRENNDEYLANRPYTVVEDLAVIYAINLGDSNRGHMSTAITDHLLETYGLSVTELHDIAMDNLSRADISFKSMSEVLAGLMYPGGAPEDMPMFEEMEASPMYVLTINNSIGGAAAILDEKTMGEIAERLNGDYVVIPSSTNEVIVVPISNALTTGQLDEMVHEVNETQVSVEERLSEHVYMYDAKEHQLLTAEHYEERRAAKEHDIVAEITSVKDKLMDKSAEVVKKEAAREHPIKAKDVMVLA